MSFYPRALSFFPHFRHSGLLLSPMSVSVFFLPTIYGFSSFYRHRLTFYDWYPPSLLWLILWLIWRLGLSACWSHRGTRARVLGLPPPFRPLVLVLGFLSAPRTLNGVAMVDRPHYHPHAPLLLTANLVFFCCKSVDNATRNPETWIISDDFSQTGTFPRLRPDLKIFKSYTEVVFSHFVRYQRHWNRGVVSAITFSTSYIFLQNGSAESYETNAQSFQLLTFDIVRIIGV